MNSSRFRVLFGLLATTGTFAWPGAGVAALEPGPDIVAPFFVGVGTYRVGRSTIASMHVNNRGTLDLVIGQIAALNAIEPPFAFALDGCSNQVLRPHSRCDIQVSFAPIQAGYQVADFDIPSNDPDTPDAVVNLSGIGALIGLSTIGIQIDAGRCTNRSTGQSFPLPRDGSRKLPCEYSGLDADAGDALTLFVRGTADSAFEVVGHGLVMGVEHVRCSNETTGQSVDFDIAPISSLWNCIARGLSASPGDIVSMTVFGDAQ